MKTFYTERDITDMHANGVTELELDDDVVITDLARDKAIALGFKLKPVEKRSGVSNGVAPQPAAPAEKPGPTGAVSNTDLAAQVKSAVIARLGTTDHNDLLDQIIPQVLARLGR